MHYDLLSGAFPTREAAGKIDDFELFSWWHWQEILRDRDRQHCKCERICEEQETIVRKRKEEKRRGIVARLGRPQGSWFAIGRANVTQRFTLSG